VTSNPIVVLWNPHSGMSEVSVAARSLLESRDECRLLETSSGPEAIERAADAAEQGAELVVAAGGDGTVNAVAQGLLRAGESARLGVIPTGTGNDLCRSLAVPLDPLQAAQWLLDHGEDHVRRIDVAELRSPSKQSTFVNMATGGNSGRFTQQLTDEMKEFWGPLCYLRGTLTIVSDLIVFNARIRFDDGPQERFNALNVFIANGRTAGGGLRAAPQASLEDGLLDAIIVLDGTPVDLAGLATRYVVGDYLQSELIIHRRVRRLSLQADPTMMFSADGDVVTDEPVEFLVREKALQVVVGADYDP